MSRVIRKPVFAYAQTGADQLRHKCTADHHFCFSFKDSTIPLFPKSEIFKPLFIFRGCTPRDVSDLVGNTKYRFSPDTAHICWALFLVWFLFNVPVNNFSVIMGRSHRFLCIYQYFGELKDTTRGSWGSNPGPLVSESDALPLSHRGWAL